MRSFPTPEPTSERVLRPRTLSLWAAGLLLVFALTAYAGVNILEYLALANRIWFGPRDQPLAGVLNAVSPWQNTSSVAAVARSDTLELIQAEAPNDTAALQAAMEEMAAVTPTSTSAWLALAGIRKAQGASMEDVLAAFRMSALTGSHEGYFATQRAVFGLVHWKELPQADRQIVVRDILTSAGTADAASAVRYGRILAAKSETEREEIKAAVVNSGRATKRMLHFMGV